MREKRDFLSLADYSKEELIALTRRAAEMKAGLARSEFNRILENRCVGILFEKASTRTRVSFEVGVSQLGGYPIFLNRDDIQLGRGEPMKDTARVLSGYVDALVLRTYGHEIIEEMAKWSTVPVINGLTDLLHPCQVLADLFTAQEAGLDISAMNAAWIGDGNNMANSWINAAEVMGFRLTVACPESYDPEITPNGKNVVLTRDPREAIREADLVSTDVWASMGQEDEAEKRREAFRDFQVNEDLMAAAKKPVFVLHCLPAHRGEEITEQVMESERSLIWKQAENRLHVQKAILEMLLCG